MHNGTAFSGGCLQGPSIFTLRGDTAADMPLCFVFFENFLDLKIQRSVVKRQTLLNILMYCRLRNSEFFCRFAHGGAVFYDVGSQLAGALLNVSFQDPTRSLSRYTGVYAASGGKIQNMSYNN